MESPAATPGVTADEKSPDRIEREMEDTRDSITQKVAALENQVLGTIQTATNTISDTVQTVRDTVTAAPGAMKETVQETVAAVKDSVKETFTSVRDTVTSFSMSDCVRNNPAATVGSSFVTGLLTGYFLLGGRDTRPLMARGQEAPTPDGRPVAARSAYAPDYAERPAPAAPGLFAGLMGMVSGELQQLAKQALSTAVESLKRSVNDRVPRMMDDAVQNLTTRVTDATGLTGDRHAQPVSRGPAATPSAGF